MNPNENIILWMEHILSKGMTPKFPLFKVIHWGNSGCYQTNYTVKYSNFFFYYGSLIFIKENSNIQIKYWKSTKT